VEYWPQEPVLEMQPELGNVISRFFLSPLLKLASRLNRITILKVEKIADSANPEILNAIKLSKVNSLDVRPTLERGGDPFNEIMGELMTLQKGYAVRSNQYV